MAKLQGISGGLSGRTGSFTYRQSRGQTIVSQYQPVVKNPNTQGQQEQRAKFKLMSQLAAIMSPGFGTMGVTKRPAKQTPSQRNSFVSLNFPLVTVTSEDSEVKATIAMEQVKLTSSFRPLSSINVSEPGMATMTNIPSEVTTIRLMMVGYRQNQAEIIRMVDLPVFEGAITYYYSNYVVQGEKITFLAYGLIPSESTKSKIDINNIHTPEDEDFISAVDLNAMVANGSMAETMTVGANVTVS